MFCKITRVQSSRQTPYYPIGPWLALEPLKFWFMNVIFTSKAHYSEENITDFQALIKHYIYSVGIIYNFYILLARNL